MRRPTTRAALLVAAVCLPLLLAPSAARAQCNTGSSQADRDLWAVHDCWWDFVLWQYRAYRMWDSNWGNWGFRDACNRDLEYPKAVNASYLLTYGLTDDYSLQWHATIDYRDAGEAWSSSTHERIDYVPSTSRAFLAQAPSGLTRMGCLLFDGDAPGTANPATRSGDYVHEGWHHWQRKHGYKAEHMQGPIGACTLTSEGCDWYYWHRVSEFDFGHMWRYTPDGRLFHSPTQAQVEYLCDVAELGEGWVPNSVTVQARSEANQRLANRFRNAVGYRCGDPRPW